jgi:ribosomal protein L28
MYFLEKNSLIIIVIVAVLASGVCVWAYLDFQKDMQSISDFMDLSADKKNVLKLSSKISEQLSSSSTEKISITPNIIKNISTSLESKAAKEIKVSADVLKSLSAN